MRSARTRVPALQSLSLHAESRDNLIQAYSTKNRPVFGPGWSFGEPLSLGCDPQVRPAERRPLTTFRHHPVVDVSFAYDCSGGRVSGHPH